MFVVTAREPEDGVEAGVGTEARLAVLNRVATPKASPLALTCHEATNVPGRAAKRERDPVRGVCVPANGCGAA